MTSEAAQTLDSPTDDLWASVEDVYTAVLEHPFMASLKDGTLDRDVFRYYTIQDTLYLREYSRVLSVAASLAPTTADALLVNKSASALLQLENDLHETFFDDFGVSLSDALQTPLSPTNLAYTSYMLKIAHTGTFADAIAAVLPCGWIYWEVGKELGKAGSPEPIYQRWIDTYESEEYAEAMTAWLALMNRLATDMSPAEWRRARDIFVQGSRYEWMFWDMGYRRESWPV